MWLRLAAFLSGGAALLFETLWFRQASLTLGNSVWAAGVVLASFMLGLGLGNVWGGRVGPRLRRPARVYALLELGIGASGLALVLLLPRLPPIAALLLSQFLEFPLALNAVRFLLAGVLMTLPAAAMGATLPLLVKVDLQRHEGFGTALGQLYGWNTLGAVVGALAGEMVLIAPLGIAGTGVAAAMLNGGAAAIVLAAYKREGAPTPAPGDRPRLGRRGLSLLGATALCGGILLAFEVVWFRFVLLLSVPGTDQAFAVMLAVVLVGISLGGFAGSTALRRWPAAHLFTPAACALAAMAAVVSYSSLTHVLSALPGRGGSPLALAAVSGWLFLPVSLISGTLFTLLGRSLHDFALEPARTAGLLTLANTLGAAIGSIAAGWLLIPSLGLEKSFFLLALAYLVAGLCAWDPRPAPAPSRIVGLASAAAGGLAVLFFPFGLMERAYQGAVVQDYRSRGFSLAALEEGLTETAFLFRRDLLGHPVEHRLVTNSYSMSASSWRNRRYMALFAHLPLALHHQPRRALVVCFGVGVTARALAVHPELERIDVVDISQSILGLRRFTAPPENDPLDSPRVRLLVEDGRFFLLTSSERYDVITGEPPPPKTVGMANLYSREYFALIRERLSEGGLASYWLPVHQLHPAESKAVAGAFCDVFPDCTLWSGAGYDWILLGSRAGMRAPSDERVRSAWQEPRIRGELETLGLGSAASLGATFLGDSQYLRAWVASQPPLVDNHPRRLSVDYANPRDVNGEYRGVLEATAAARRFDESPWVRRHWPESLRAETSRAFRDQLGLNVAFRAEHGDPRDVAEARAASSWALPQILILLSNPDDQRVASALEAKSEESVLLYHLAVRDLAHGRYAAAEDKLAVVHRRNPAAELVAQIRALALCWDGKVERATEVAAPWRKAAEGKAGEAFWSWLATECAPPSGP